MICIFKNALGETCGKGLLQGIQYFLKKAPWPLTSILTLDKITYLRAPLLKYNLSLFEYSIEYRV